MASNPDPVLTALVTRADVSTALNCSMRHVQRLMDRGEIPQPLRVGALVRWPKQTILDWIAAGCPRQVERSRRGRPR